MSLKQHLVMDETLKQKVIRRKQLNEEKHQELLKHSIGKNFKIISTPDGRKVPTNI